MDSKKMRKQPRKGGLEEKIREFVNNGLVANATEEQTTHFNVCKSLVELSDKEQMPISYLLYFCVGKDAHKTPTYEKGYKKFDAAKGEVICKWASMFAAKFGERLRTNDKVLHVLTKFYEKQGKSDKTFKKYLNGMEDLPRPFTFKDIEVALKIGKQQRDEHGHFIKK
jgi:hypothetical protein